MDKQTDKLRSTSINLLQTGAYLQDDIYGFDSTRLLAKSGIFLDNDRLHKLKNLNRGSEVIYVTSKTYIKLVKKQADTRRQDLEEKTGYISIKQKSVELLDGIAQNKAVEHKVLLEVSNELSNQLESTSAPTILSLINALAPVDEYLQRHCVNTGLLNGLIGRWLGMSKESVDRLVLIGLLHDCGKAKMPARILNAPRKLTITEYQVIKTHTIRSYELLDGFPDIVRNAARSHHEKVDGKGYPDRLKQNDIPLEALITAISDIYDAMVSQRAYKTPRSPFGVMASISKLAGTELDADLVDLFTKNMPSEIVGKQIMLSDGTVGLVHSFDLQDIEHPTIEVEGQLVQTSPDLFCTSMCDYFKE